MSNYFGFYPKSLSKVVVSCSKQQVTSKRRRNLHVLISFEIKFLFNVEKHVIMYGKKKLFMVKIEN